MTSNALRQETQRFIVKKPLTREYKRQGDPLVKVVNSHHCQFCKFESMHILETAAHVKREHAEEMKKVMEEEQKTSENPVSAKQDQAAPEKSTKKDRHELHFDEVPKKSSAQSPASHPQKPQKSAPASFSGENRPSPAEEKDDWLDFYED